MEPFLVWCFRDAPQELRDLSDHGGDEDYVAVIAPDCTYIPYLLEEGSAFGCCSVSEYPHPTEPGYRVLIGAHA